MVSTFTPTATGFTAIFNRPLDLGTVSSPVLNLYDNSSCTLGPADVTLVRASNGASIRGSLVVDSTGTQITFIQTGQSGVLGSAAPCTLFGVLPNDTYTVTLRSATNGFQDANGNLLDGNGDGTAGDDFVTTFVVSNPSDSVTVTLPDFARGPGQAVNGTDGTDGIPLRLLNNGSTAVTVTSVTLNLVYNPNLLTIANVPGAVDTTSTSGVAIVTFSSSGLILGPGGDAIFANLTAAVPSTAGYGEKEILDLQNIQINGGAIPALDDAAIHVVGFLGDATGDEVYTGEDAQRIARVAVGLDPGFRAWVLADPLIVGDVSGDNVLTGLDALEIAREAVGITQSTIPSLPPLTLPSPPAAGGEGRVRGVPSAILGPDPMLNIPTDFAAKPQATVWVPVNLDPGANAPRLAGLDSVELSIAYDTSRLEVYSATDVHAGSLLKGFDSFAVSLDKSAGIIRLSATRSAGPLEGFGGGSVALIGFRIKDNAPPGAAIINLLQNAGTTQTLLGGTDAQGHDFFFDLEPQPSNAAGDALDGRIIVTPQPEMEDSPFSICDCRLQIAHRVSRQSKLGNSVAVMPPGSPGYDTQSSGNFESLHGGRLLMCM